MRSTLELRGCSQAARLLVPQLPAVSPAADMTTVDSLEIDKQDISHAPGDGRSFANAVRPGAEGL